MARAGSVSGMSASTFRAHGRPDIVKLARAWIGTPYHHQASCQGVGTDCLGLVRGVYRALYGFEPQELPAYSQDWAEVNRRETMLEAARCHLCEVAPADAADGDVVLFRIFKTGLAKHAGIVTGDGVFVHAMENRPVAEVAMSNWWRRRLAAAFSFPGLARQDGLALRQYQRL